MPVDALPVPWPEQPDGGLRLHRVYRDVLGRPLSGVVTITGTARTELDGTVTVPVPVNATLTDGVLDEYLPADTYRLEANLRSVDGARVTDTATITLES